MIAPREESLIARLERSRRATDRYSTGRRLHGHVEATGRTAFRPRPPAEAVYVHTDDRTSKDDPITSSPAAPRRRRRTRGLIPLLWTAAIAAAALIHAKEMDRRVALQQTSSSEDLWATHSTGPIKAAWREIGRTGSTSVGTSKARSNALAGERQPANASQEARRESASADRTVSRGVAAAPTGERETRPAAKTQGSAGEDSSAALHANEAVPPDSGRNIQTLSTPSGGLASEQQPHGEPAAAIAKPDTTASKLTSADVANPTPEKSDEAATAMAEPVLREHAEITRAPSDDTDTDTPSPIRAETDHDETTSPDPSLRGNAAASDTAADDPATRNALEQSASVPEARQDVQEPTVTARPKAGSALSRHLRWSLRKRAIRARRDATLRQMAHRFDRHRFLVEQVAQKMP